MNTDTVIILGGSLAGLCAAGALAPHVGRVILVDRDALPTTTSDRTGVPQARHVHAMLVRGRRELERRLPGFEAAMLAEGAHDLDFLLDFATLRPMGWWTPVESDLRTLFASRTLVESVARRLVRRLPNVEVRERTDVLGLHGDASRVTGVRVADRDGGGETLLHAALVVDACGRGSRAPQWLAALGLPAPDETVVDGRFGYATRWYSAPRPEDRPETWWWKGVWIDPKDLERDFAGVLSPVEGDRWIVTLGGGGGLYPPTDETGFMEAVRNLRAPLIAEALTRATPLSPVYGSREMANRFRHYERWPVRLAGFVAVGDAACKFNPVYGQGMTSAAVCAGILGDAVAADGPAHPTLPTRFFKTQGRFVQDPWALATGADFRFRGVEGVRPPLTTLTTRYLDRLFEASATDPNLRATIGRVIHLLEPPRRLFAPSTMLRVARHAARLRPPAATRAA